jgi:hypothetical protein
MVATRLSWSGRAGTNAFGLHAGPPCNLLRDRYNALTAFYISSPIGRAVSGPDPEAGFDDTVRNPRQEGALLWTNRLIWANLAAELEGGR